MFYTMNKATLEKILTDQEKVHFPLWKGRDVCNLHWEDLLELGLIFIRTVHNGIAPGGSLVALAVNEITERAIKNNLEI